MSQVGARGKAPGQGVRGEVPPKLKDILKLNEQYSALDLSI